MPQWAAISFMFTMCVIPVVEVCGMICLVGLSLSECALQEVVTGCVCHPADEVQYVCL